jgi:hypothetical protein
MFLEEEIPYFQEASKFTRTVSHPVFVQSFPSEKVSTALAPNEVGFDISEDYKYERFPVLKDSLLTEPRRVQK